MNQDVFQFLPETGREESRFLLFPEVPAAVTADFAHAARNHCCATMLTNYCLYLESKGSLFPDLPRAALFEKIHRFVPNGPIFSITKRAPKVFASLEISSAAYRLPLRLRDTPCSKMTVLCRCLEKQKDPAALLVAAGPLSWHWILAVGTVRIFGIKYLLVSTGWHRTPRLYRPDSGCRVLAAWEFSASASSTRSSSS